MKKKSVRKVSSAKKVISKSPLKKKKSFSLKSWLLGGLVILVASAYGLYQYNLQPQGIKVLQIPGTVLDYLEPEAVSINAVKNCGQDPECADLVDAARRAGATTSLQQQSQTSIRVAREIEQSLESKPIKESKNEEVVEAREEAVKTAESIVTKVETQINTHLNAAKIANQPVVGSGAGCQTQHFTVAEGETMVGLVANSQTDPNAGENTGSNMIVKCSGGSWVPTGCYEKNGVVSGPSTCRLSVKPIYAGGKNCYNNGGSSVLGDGSISEKGDGTASRCDGGKMTEGLTKVDGLWMTASEKTKYEFDRDVKKKADQAAANKAREWECVNAGDDGKVGKWNGNGCVVDSRADNCTAKGSGYEWNSSSETCVANNAPNNNSAVYNDRDDCLDSIVDSKKETCRQSPNGSTFIRIPLTSGTSAAAQYVGGVYDSEDNCEKNLPSGQNCRQSPNGSSWTRFTTSTTTNPVNTPQFEGGKYGTEAECESTNPGKSCRQSPNGDTWAVFTLAQTNFGLTPSTGEAGAAGGSIVDNIDDCQFGGNSQGGGKYKCFYSTGMVFPGRADEMGTAQGGEIVDSYQDCQYGANSYNANKFQCFYSTGTVFPGKADQLGTAKGGQEVDRYQDCEYGGSKTGVGKYKCFYSTGTAFKGPLDRIGESCWFSFQCGNGNSCDGGGLGKNGVCNTGDGTMQGGSIVDNIDDCQFGGNSQGGGKYKCFYSTGMVFPGRADEMGTAQGGEIVDSYQDCQYGANSYNANKFQCFYSTGTVFPGKADQLGTAKGGQEVDRYQDCEYGGSKTGVGKYKCFYSTGTAFKGPLDRIGESCWFSFQCGNGNSCDGGGLGKNGVCKPVPEE